MIRSFIISMFIISTACAADWQIVAYDDAGVTDKQPHLMESNGDWRFDNPGTTNEALRTCAFGDRVEFVYMNLNPQAHYKVRLGFFSDGARELTVKAGDTMVLPSLRLVAGTPVEREVEVPAEVFKSGKLKLAIQHTSGANTVVSEVTVLSSDPTMLGAIPANALELPRISPRPVAVAGVSKPSIDLSGIWRFNGTADIQVPGEWVMQGFDVKPGQAAIYERTFTVPKDWASQRIKLRCDAVFSDAIVWVNGVEAGRHLGGFTPFELDVTAMAKAGAENVLKLAVTSESIADRLASASQYACHPLGGITRKIQLFAVPGINVASEFVTTTFDKDYRDARLNIHLGVANESSGDENAVIEFKIFGPDGKALSLDPAGLKMVLMPAQAGQHAMRAGKVADFDHSVTVPTPRKWDPEHPVLYTLETRLQNGATCETLRQRFGFRQVEVRGNQVFVNNMPVKLRGSNHHEVYPITGRSLPPGIDALDVDLFRKGNVNLLRTCHYPPDESLLDAADELGMFIECEAPLCWAPGSGHKDLVCRETAEMVIAYRNHPSVLYWSLANESQWGSHFVASSKMVRLLDPTRPQTFNNPGDQKYTEIANLHYPGHGGPAHARSNTKYPVYHGEDTHLNAYNRLELATDPSLRDLWGKYIRELWDDMYATQGLLGQSIWSGVDDTFYLKDDQTVGYGTWGPIDGWRRQKPEYWNMKKAYSPVRLLNTGSLVCEGGVIKVAVENRQNFTNLNEMKVAWKLGRQSGVISADIPARGKGILPIAIRKQPRPGEALELTFTDPRGFVADEFHLSLRDDQVPPARTSSGVYPGCTLDQTDTVITVRAGRIIWHVNKQTGQLASADHLELAGPQLMLLPLNSAGETQMTGKTKVWQPFTSPCSGWTCNKVSASEAGGTVTVTVAGRYEGAEGAYVISFRPGGAIEIAYDFMITKAVNPRQTGLVFSLPRDCETFSWERKGYWDVYPDDHIARLKGTVKASEGFEATSVGPRTKPSHPWRLDNLPYGNNDFCSTKHNVIRATLADSAGHGIAIDGRGEQHIRCWRTDKVVNVLVADYSNGGSERFLRGLAGKDDRPLKPGAKVAGRVCLTPQ